MKEKIAEEVDSRKRRYGNRVEVGQNLSNGIVKAP
jgi:hypothetical protein